MAHRLIWSPTALRDVDEIAEFIARDSRRYAKVVVGKIVDACERLKLMPTASAIVPEFDRAEIRQLIVYQYRIIVRVRDEAVEVVAVIHGARDVGNMLEKLI